MISKILNLKLYTLICNLNDYLNLMFRDKIIYFYSIIILISYSSFIFNLSNFNLICMPLILIIILMNTPIHFFFSSVIFIKYILPIFIYSDGVRETNNSPIYINSAIIFISFSIILIININLFLKKNDNKIIIHNFNNNFMYLLTFMSFFNVIVIIFIGDNIKYIPFFSQIFSKSLFLYFFPLIFLFLKNKLNKNDLIIITLSIFNVLLFVYLNNFSRSLLIILLLILLTFGSKNLFQLILITIFFILFYPVLHFLRSDLIISNFSTFIEVLLNYDLFVIYCQDFNSSITKLNKITYCLIHDNIKSTQIFSFINFPQFIIISFFERLFNVYELSLVFLNNISFNQNIYINNIYSLLPSSFIEKPNFYYYKSYDLFNYQLKPITDELSTSTFGTIAESVVILKSNFIFVFVVMSIFINLVYRLNEKFFYNQSFLSLNIVFISMFIFKESYTAIFIDLIFYLVIIFLLRYLSKYFIQN